MDKKYYITYGVPLKNEIIAYQKQLSISNPYKHIYLIECNKKGYYLDSILKSLDDYLKDYLNRNSKSIYSEGINIINEYKQIIRDDKLKMLLNQF